MARTTEDALDSIAVGAVAIHSAAESSSRSRLPDVVAANKAASCVDSPMVAAVTESKCAHPRRYAMAVATAAMAVRQDMDLAPAADQDMEMVAVVSADRTDFQTHADRPADAVAAAVVATDCTVVSFLVAWRKNNRSNQ